MRWKFKPKPKPRWGDTRVFKAFALFPRRIKDNIVWLETYNRVEVYTDWAWHFYRAYTDDDNDWD